MIFSSRSAEFLCSDIVATITPRSEKTGLRGFPTRPDTNRSVQPQKIARGLKFRGFPTRPDTNRSVQPQKIARGLKFRI